MRVVEQLSSVQKNLVCSALDAQARSYSPYSHFAVGAAVLTREGQVFQGANVENASYGLCVCAERNAVMQAVLAGHKQMMALAVASTASPPVVPCGMCLQVLSEFASDCEVMLVNPQSELIQTRLSALLPLRFQKQDLP